MTVNHSSIMTCLHVCSEEATINRTFQPSRSGNEAGLSVWKQLDIVSKLQQNAEDSNLIFCCFRFIILTFSLLEIKIQRLSHTNI